MDGGKRAGSGIGVTYQRFNAEAPLSIQSLRWTTDIPVLQLSYIDLHNHDLFPQELEIIVKTLS